MKQWTMRLFVVVFGLAIGAIAPSAEARQGQAVDPALKKAADARNAARQAGDAATYGRYILDDAYFGSTDGISSKQERIAALKDGTKPLTFKISDEKYRMFGETAIHTYRTDPTSAQGQSARYIEVWVKQGGEWKLAAVQFSTLAKP